MSDSPTTTRCAGCGKPIDVTPEGKALASGSKVIRITSGRFKKDEYTEQKEWGLLHEHCFNRSIDSPDAAMDEVRRQAKQGKSAA